MPPRQQQGYGRSSNQGYASNNNQQQDMGYDEGGQYGEEGNEQDMNEDEQYQEGGEEGEEQYDENEGEQDDIEVGDDQEDPGENEEDGEEKNEGHAAAPSGRGSVKHSKFSQDPHHSKTMSHFHDVASEGFTEDHVHSFIHVLILIVAMLAFHSGMTAGHHPTHEAAKAAHQGSGGKGGASKSR